MFDKSGVAINEDTIAQIAGMAALEVAGVAALRPLKSGPSRFLPKNEYRRSVDIKRDNGVLTLTVGLAVKGGVRLGDVAQNAQLAVKDKVQSMTGNAVSSVNVRVDDIIFEDSPEPAPAN